MSADRPTLAQLRAVVQKGRHREIGNWLARRVARPSAVYGTWGAVRIGMTANQATLASLTASLCGAAAIGSGGRLAFAVGVGLGGLAFWLDHVDGQIAREPEVLEDPDVAFYARLNPHQAQGDGLMCLCPLSPGNWAACLVRAVRRAMRRQARPAGPTAASRVVAQAPDTQRSPLQ